MSLTFNPFGLSLVEYKGGKNRMATSVYYIESGTQGISVGQGDPLMITGDADGFVNAGTTPPNPGTNVPSSYNGLYVGQAVSFSWTSPTGVQMKNQSYLPAGTTTLNSMPIEVQVADLPYNIYRVQCNGALPVVSPNVANFYNFNFTPCNTTSANPRTSQSTVALDVLAGSGTANQNYWFSAKIVGCPKQSINGASNSWYDPYPEVLVIINAHVFKPGTNAI